MNYKLSNNDLAVMSDQESTYLILVYVINQDSENITLRFLGPDVLLGFYPEYIEFKKLDEDGNIENKRTGLRYKIMTVKDADLLVDFDEDIRYLNPLTTKDKALNIKSISEGSNLIFREYNELTGAYSTPERCIIKSINGSEVVFYSMVTGFDKKVILNREDNSFKYFVKIK